MAFNPQSSPPRQPQKFAQLPKVDLSKQRQKFDRLADLYATIVSTEHLEIVWARGACTDDELSVVVQILFNKLFFFFYFFFFVYPGTKGSGQSQNKKKTKKKEKQRKKEKKTKNTRYYLRKK